MHRHDLKSRFCLETSARHFPGWLNVCTDHLSRDRLGDFLHEAGRRGFPHPEELPVDESLKAFARSLAEMVRDHQAVSDTFMSRDSESVLNNLASEVSGDGPPELREFLDTSGQAEPYFSLAASPPMGPGWGAQFISMRWHLREDAEPVRRSWNVSVFLFRAFGRDLPSHVLSTCPPPSGVADQGWSYQRALRRGGQVASWELEYDSGLGFSLCVSWGLSPPPLFDYFGTDIFSLCPRFCSWLSARGRETQPFIFRWALVESGFLRSRE